MKLTTYTRLFSTSLKTALKSKFKEDDETYVTTQKSSSQGKIEASMGGSWTRDLGI